MKSKVVWINCDSTHLGSCLYSSRGEADRSANKLEDRYDRKRTACLRLEIAWEDGDGMDDCTLQHTPERTVDDE